MDILHRYLKKALFACSLLLAFSIIASGCEPIMKDEEDEEIHVTEGLSDIMNVLLGKKSADIALKNCMIADYASGEFVEADMAIAGGRIAYIGKDLPRSNEVYDLKGKYVVPGFIDGYVSMESSGLTPAEYAKLSLSRGVTTVVINPMTSGLISGSSGVNYYMNVLKDTPLSVFVAYPSAQRFDDLMTTSGSVTPYQLKLASDQENVKGVGGIRVSADISERSGEFMLKMLEIAMDNRLPTQAAVVWENIDDISAIRSFGLNCVLNAYSYENAKRSISAGMWMTVSSDILAGQIDMMPDLLEIAPDKLMMVSGQLTAAELLRDASFESAMKRLVESGIEPIDALKFVTRNPSSYWGLDDRGLIEPGMRADIVILDDVDNFRINRVFIEGDEVAAAYSVTADFTESDISVPFVDLNPHPLSDEDIAVKVSDETRIRIIDVSKGSLMTDLRTTKATIEEGYFVSDPEEGILKMVVQEAHGTEKSFSVMALRGFGLKEGAVATSLTAGPSNIVAVGSSDDDIMGALREIRRMGGGIVVYKDGEIVQSIEMSVGGFMAEGDYNSVIRTLDSIKGSLISMGCEADNPVLFLMRLTDINMPDIRVSDKGLIDYGSSELLDFIVEE